MLKVYSKENCQQCEQLKKVLSMREIKYQELKLDKDFLLEDVSEFNVRSFPIVVNNDVLVGSMQEALMAIAAGQIA